MDITQVTQVTDELHAAFLRLVPQLTQSNPPPTRADLEKLVASQSSLLYIARHPDFGAEIVGALTLIIYRVPTGVRAWIEDVVVDAKARGRGIGEALTRVAIERAAQEGAGNVGLTSNPSREAANRLYQRMGFELRKTNVYRYPLGR
jgi:ribosomal protein S18 acetylase RimI-like enzyme